MAKRPATGAGAGSDDRLPYPGPPPGPPAGGDAPADDDAELTPEDVAARLARDEAEIARLRADNEALRAATQELARYRGGRPGRTMRVLRSSGAAILIVLALLLGVTANVAVWAKDVALDTTEFEEVVGPLSQDPAVAEAVSVVVVDELLTATDARQRSQEALDEFLPSDVQFLSGAIVSAVESTLTDGVETLIESDQFNTLWRQVTTVAHERLVDTLLDDEEALLQQRGAEVVLDLRPLIEAAQARLPSDGIGGAIADAPIPADAGVFTIAESRALGEARDAAQLLDMLGTWLPLIALALLVAGVALARRRRQTVIVSMIAFALLMLVTLVALRVARRLTLNELDLSETDRRAVAVVWDAAAAGLRNTTWALFAAAVLIAIGAWVSGPSRPAVAIRRWVGRVMAKGRERGGITIGDRDLVGQVVRPHKNAFRIGGVVIALVVLVLAPGISILGLILAAIFLLLYLGIIELVAPGWRRPAPSPDGGGDPAAGRESDRDGTGARG